MSTKIRNTNGSTSTYGLGVDFSRDGRKIGLGSVLAWGALLGGKIAASFGYAKTDSKADSVTRKVSHLYSRDMRRKLMPRPRTGYPKTPMQASHVCTSKITNLRNRTGRRSWGSAGLVSQPGTPIRIEARSHAASQCSATMRED